MNYVKVINDQVDSYPYTLKDLKSDNPNVSFPKPISESVLIEYGLYPVTVLNLPEFNDSTQKCVQNSLPTLNNGVWELGWSVSDLTDEEIALKNEALSMVVRTERDRLLSESDWTQVADAPVDQTAWAAYRQLLRDITDQPGFPTTVNWPTKPV